MNDSTRINKKELYAMAKRAGGIPSRYGEEFGFRMSPIALERFFAMAKREILKNYATIEASTKGAKI